MTRRIPIVLATAVLLITGVSPAAAAVPYAGADQDRRAKQAVPPAGKALLYVYRQQDQGPGESVALSLNNRAVGRLAPATYLYWAVEPGRVELKAGEAGARSLSLQVRDGRIYFVRMTVSETGVSSLRQVSYGSGRQEIHRTRLVRETGGKPAPVAGAARSGFNLIFKGGSYQLNADSQNILLAQRNFTAGGSGFGAEAEWQFANGIAVGAEVFGHSHDYTTVASTAAGDVSALHIMVNIKKYFRTGQTVQPYLGAGLGTVTADFSSSSGAGITGSGAGFAVQAMGGVAFRWQHVGLYTELKFQSAKAEDANGETVDVSGLGLFAGVSAHF
jgi:opacity protein-like surface antigen